MSELMTVKVEIEVQAIADAIICKLTEDGTLAEVVRCKDCKHWHGKVNDAVAECDGVMGQLSTTPEFFCAYGDKGDKNATND